jgi:hypothetical protein
MSSMTPSPSWAQIAGKPQKVVKPVVEALWHEKLTKDQQLNAIASHMQRVLRHDPGQYSYCVMKHNKHGESDLLIPTCGGKPQRVKKEHIVIPACCILTRCCLCFNRCIVPGDTRRQHRICENCRDLTCPKAFDPAIVENFKNFGEFMKINLPLHWVTTVRKDACCDYDTPPTTLEELRGNCRCILCR